MLRIRFIQVVAQVLALVTVSVLAVGVSSAREPTATELRRFDAFLDNHWETADELYRDPALINNDRFLRGHPDLREFLDDNPETARAIERNPRKYVWRDRDSARADASARADEEPRQLTSEDIRNFERYLDRHYEVAQPLYRDPDLVNDKRFVRSHESLEQYFEDNPQAASAIRANPERVLWRDRKVDAGQLIRQFLQ